MARVLYIQGSHAGPSRPRICFDFPAANRYNLKVAGSDVLAGTVLNQAGEHHGEIERT